MCEEDPEGGYNCVCGAGYQPDDKSGMCVGRYAPIVLGFFHTGRKRAQKLHDKQMRYSLNQLNIHMDEKHERIPPPPTLLMGGKYHFFIRLCLV